MDRISPVRAAGLLAVLAGVSERSPQNGAEISFASEVITAPLQNTSIPAEVSAGPNRSTFAPLDLGVLVKELGFSGILASSISPEAIEILGFGSKTGATPAELLGTTFSLESLSKQFTAAAILKLQDQGKLLLDDPISKYLPGVPQDKSTVTIRHLMEHSSGIPGDPPLGINPANGPEMLKGILAKPLGFTSGTRWVYSNAGYILLAAVVDSVSGQDFQSFVKDNLFAPAGLVHTDFNGKLSWGRRGCTGILSTPQDLALWDTALRQGMLSSGSLETLKQVNQWGYSGGWFVGALPTGQALFSHDGLGRKGEVSFFARVSEADPQAWVAVLGAGIAPDKRNDNQSLAWTRLRQAASLGLLSDKLAAVTPSELSQWQGGYRMESGAEIQVAIAQDPFGNAYLNVSCVDGAASQFLAFPVASLEQNIALGLSAQLNDVLDRFNAGEEEPLRSLLQLTGRRSDELLGYLQANRDNDIQVQVLGTIGAPSHRGFSTRLESHTGDCVILRWQTRIGTDSYTVQGTEFLNVRQMQSAVGSGSPFVQKEFLPACSGKFYVFEPESNVPVISLELREISGGGKLLKLQTASGTLNAISTVDSVAQK